MKELGKLAIFIFFTTIIAIFCFLLIGFLQYSGDLIIEDYEVELSTDGTLIETYEYNVGASGKYQMLYRYWDEDVIYNSNLFSPHLKVTDVKCPHISYIRDYKGDVEILSGSSTYSYTIQDKAFYNEIGCYNPNYFEKGKYELKIYYKISPPVEYDEQYYHLNFKLARNHIPYKNVKININDPSGDIVEIFSHPPMEITKLNNKYVITGSSPRDNIIEFEFVSKNIDYGVKTFQNNILEKTVNANNNYNLGHLIFIGLYYIFLALSLGFGIILIILYYLKGREKDYVVPEYLNFVPKKRKPWLVNLIFHKTENKIDRNAYYATLLDLHVRNVITLKDDNGNLIIQINNSNEKLDDYEENVVNFLKHWSRNNIFDAADFSSRIISNKYSYSDVNEISKDLRYLDKNYKNEVSNEFIINGRKIFSFFIFIFLISTIIILFALLRWGSVYPIISSIFMFSLILVIQSLIAFLAPPSLFGQWKDDFYKERLEWDSFRRFLSDMAQLKKYELQDIIIWKEWLVYATALGIGEKVAKSLEKFNIHINEVRVVPVMYGSFSTIHFSIMHSRSSSSGGGGHGGGGFGGGGAGGR